MTGALRAGALTAVAVTVMLGLAACTSPSPMPSPPAPTPSVVETPTPAPTPTPTAEADPLAAVTAIVARPEALELLDSGGNVVSTLAYDGSVSDVISTLSSLLGEAPIDEPYDGGNHNPPGVLHIWDDALVVDERHYESVSAPAIVVYFDAGSVRGLDLRTSTGVHVGDTFEALGDQIDPDLWTCSGWAVEFVEVPSSHSSTPNKVGVGLSEWKWDRSSDSPTQVDYVGSIVAPTSVAAGCV